MTTSGGVVQSEDFTKAALTHWLHNIASVDDELVSSRAISSIKQPLENRIWYNYNGGGGADYNGALDQPAYEGRVLDDGTTQASKATFTTNVARFLALAGHAHRPQGRGSRNIPMPPTISTY